ncbi:hypothetical protein RISK_005017 [Rhodopirellula islandica]|uniref:Uncharacterized protein n=1 Tax=Rhodopirellula islandica TaxID=595434 RepID=A0A0J1B8J7_RHOIS|nr:hypothetical protein RISK_005017 [Rhodopirellula islandica]
MLDLSEEFDSESFFIPFFPQNSLFVGTGDGALPLASARSVPRWWIVA